jgi:hypothetical protein
LLLVFFIGFTCHAQKEEVQKTVETFLEGFQAKDTIKMKTVCSDKLILQSIKEYETGGILADKSKKEFYKSIGILPKKMNISQKILSYSIQIDGSMAHVWAPYEFYMNGRLNYKGVNAFTLLKENGLWKIIYLVDTKRK